MLEALETYVSTQYAYAKKSNRYDTINAYFHNAFGATCFALDNATSKEESQAIEKFWEEWKEKFDDHMWNIPLDYTPSV